MEPPPRPQATVLPDPASLPPVPARPLDRLGLQPRDEDALLLMAQRGAGLIVVAGAPGSGRSTTLLALDHALRVSGRSALAIHCIADGASARAALAAAHDGQLVLARLEAPDAAGAVQRLQSLGLGAAELAHTLLGVIAQRRVRGLCPDCAQRVPLTAAAWDILLDAYAAIGPLPLAEARERLLAAAGVAEPAQVSRGIAVGCAQDGGCGQRDWVVLAEVLDNTGDLPALLARGAAPAQLAAAAIAQGMHALRQDALEKMVQGRIDWGQAREPAH